MCPVSGLNPDARIPGMCSSMLKLNFLGSGFILLFSFTKMIIFLLLVLGLITFRKLYKNITNYRCGDNIEGVPKCSSDYITFWSVANYGIEQRDEETNRILWFFSLFVTVVVAYMNVFVKSSHHRLDAKNDVPDDFTLMIENLPQEESLQSLKKTFEKYGAGFNPQIPIRVERVVIAYQMDKFLKIKMQLEKKKKKALKIFSKETKNFKSGDEIDSSQLSPAYQKLVKEVESLQDQLYVEEEDLITQRRSKTSQGIAFITFDTKAQAYRVKKFWRTKPTNIF